MRRRRRDRRRGDMRSDYRDMRHEYTYYPENSDYRRRSRYDMRRDYAGQMSGDYRGDYNSSDYRLSENELMEWSKDLYEMVDPQDKYYFSKENFDRRMKDMGYESRDYTMPELYTAALMCYTDYGKALGSHNLDDYLKMGKAFLCDDDAELQYGEKLAAYYDNIVEGM